jgi:hypothetical protein
VSVVEAPDAMNMYTMYMNRTSANTTQIDDAAKWRIGFAAAQLMRNELGQMRTANRTTATSCVSR